MADSAKAAARISTPSRPSERDRPSPDAPAPILVLGVGNPSRGDDALGPQLIGRLQRRQAEGRLAGVDLLTDFQLQIEHSLDLCGRERVIIVDAAMGLQQAFRLTPVEPASALSWTTHSLTPAGLASLFAALFGPLPRLEQLAIGAQAFALGDGLSQRAARNLERAFDALIEEFEPLPAATVGAGRLIQDETPGRRRRSDQ